MTQAIVNELNNLHTVLEKSQMATSKYDKAVSTHMDKTTSFNKIFDKQLNKEGFKKESNETLTLNDALNKLVKPFKEDVKEVKNADNNINFSEEVENIDVNEEKVIDTKTSLYDQLAEIRDLLEQVTSEANMENSLDLTLSKDIEDFIAQLKEYCKPTAENNVEVNEWGIEIESESKSDVNQELLTEVLDKISATLEEDSENELKKELPVLFEQVLSLIDKKIESTTQVSDETKNSFDLKNTNFKSELELNSSQNEIVEFTSEIENSEMTSSDTNIKTSSLQEIQMDEEMLKELKIESVNVETSASNNGDSLLQNQTPQEQGVKAMLDQQIEPFELKIDKTLTSQLPNQPAQAKPVEVNPGRIIEQISKQMEMLQNNSKVNIVLNPESLGKVNIQLLTTKDGLSAMFTVTTQEARDLIMKGLDGLKDSLLSHGVGVDNVSVKVANPEKTEYKQDWTEQEGSNGGNKGHKNPNKQEQEKGLFEELMAQTEDKENGNV